MYMHERKSHPTAGVQQKKFLSSLLTHDMHEELNISPEKKQIRRHFRSRNPTKLFHVLPLVVTLYNE